MKIIDLLILPQLPYAGFKKRVLDEFLHNPFLDDDIWGLSLRLGASRAEVSQAIAELCQAQFLRAAGQQGYLLELLGAAEGAASPKTQRKPAPSRRVQPPAPPLEWVEVLPFGVVLLGRDGALELANERAIAWLGIPRQELNGAVFARATGVDPGLVLERGEGICFSCRRPLALEVEVRPCQQKVLIVLQDISLREELARLQAGFQEAFSTRLRLGVGEPLQALEQFLENPDAEGLGPARAAVEEIRWFLEDLSPDAPSPGERGRDPDFSP